MIRPSVAGKSGAGRQGSTIRLCLRYLQSRDAHEPVIKRSSERSREKILCKHHINLRDQTHALPGITKDDQRYDRYV